MKTRHQAALFRFVLLDAAPLHAAEWKHELMPDFWGSGMDGPVGRPQDTSPLGTRRASQGESWRDPVIAACRCIDMDYDTGQGADFFESTCLCRGRHWASCSRSERPPDDCPGAATVLAICGA